MLNVIWAHWVCFFYRRLQWAYNASFCSNGAHFNFLFSHGLSLLLFLFFCDYYFYLMNCDIALRKPTSMSNFLKQLSAHTTCTNISPQVKPACPSTEPMSSPVTASKNPTKWSQRRQAFHSSNLFPFFFLGGTFNRFKGWYTDPMIDSFDRSNGWKGSWGEAVRTLFLVTYILPARMNFQITPSYYYYYFRWIN